jgi:SRSO17 transposase
MEMFTEFQKYLDYLCEGLGHADRNISLIDYCKGLMLPLERKSIEPIAAQHDPYNVRSKHQSLHHFVADSDWSDKDILSRAYQWSLPFLKFDKGRNYWIVDDTGYRKKGIHSVGVARQYCGQLGKQENCQVAVSLSLATDFGSIPIDYRLYLPKEWTDDPDRCKKVGVPEGIIFQTKPEIAIEQIKNAKRTNIPVGIVLADAGYGDNTEFREELSSEGLPYAVGIKPGTSVWSSGDEPLPPKEWQGRGRKPVNLRRDSEHKPKSVKAVAMEIPRKAYRKITWREGTNKKLYSYFARIRVHSANMDFLREEIRDEEWLIIEWPKDEKEPIKYWLSTLPADISFNELVNVIKMRWRIEREYEELKQEFGLSQYEGRNWRGFHHHATLCIAAYVFLMTWRIEHTDTKKKWFESEAVKLPEDYKPRGSGTCSKACA